jgi:hypothetical protein
MAFAAAASACSRSEPIACKKFAASAVQLLEKSRDVHLSDEVEPETLSYMALNISLPTPDGAPSSIRSAVATVRSAFERWQPGEDLSADPETRAAAEQIDHWVDEHCSNPYYYGPSTSAR